MNAVEIEEAVSQLAEQVFDPAEFPYAFLQAFGNKETTLRKLRTGDTNKSDLGGVLQRNNIHIAIAPRGEVSERLAALRASPATAKHKVKFILATDGEWLEAEDLGGGVPLACEFARLPDYFGFFLPLAGISTVREIVENAFDIRATSKLNRLYVELLKENPDWGTDERRPDMNHFMARLIFSFFAEDTGIFADDGLFTNTVSQMSAKDSSNTHEVIGAVFRAMNTRHRDREAASIPRWADRFPFVNGGLFAGEIEVPRFTRTARSYLLQVGSLDWRQINPDIFGSMIQAVADDEERGALGMHYTSVPNILRVLNPLFLDDLRAALEVAGNNPRKLLNLRDRIKRIRVFDPACGSGNFLVIAYKALREIENEVNRRRGEIGRKTEIPLTNFRGIELRDFAAEIARLALIIAEFQCNVLYLGQQEALDDFLPLDADNWITCGNALRIDWLAICPPVDTSVKLVGEDLFSTPLDQAEIDFANAGGETYICGNPPYLGRKYQSGEHKQDLKIAFLGRCRDTLSLDYVTGWFMKASDHMKAAGSCSAFVSTNSICQGIQATLLWPLLFAEGLVIQFATPEIRWSNLAANAAGVTVSIIGLTRQSVSEKRLYTATPDGRVAVRTVNNINGYLIAAPNVVVRQRQDAPSPRSPMRFGNHPYYANALILRPAEARQLTGHEPRTRPFIRPLYGSQEVIAGVPRRCIWVRDEMAALASTIEPLRKRFERVRDDRLAHEKDSQSVSLAEYPHRFREQHTADASLLVIPIVSSEERAFLPVELLSSRAVVHNKAFAIFDAPLWNMALIASRLHWVWIGTVCVRLRTDFSYSNTLGWNTFPVPPLSEQNKTDLTRCAEEILLAREAHFPATIGELYDAKRMPDNLREAHERNDEVLERIYIGRKFRNDTERLEKLFDMHTKMTGSEKRPASSRGRRKTS